jgi:Glycosyltransferase like family 2
MRTRERIAAVVAPMALFAIGAATPTSRAARTATNAAIAGVLSGGLALAVAALRHRSTPDPLATRTPASPVHVLIPARDEAPVVADVISDLGRQDLVDRSGRPAFTLTVIDDRSTDGTGGVAAAAIVEAGLESVATCRRRDSGPDGKGAALAVVPLDDLPDDAIVLVLDADARLAPDALATLVQAFGTESPGMTARRRMLVPVDGRRAWLARWQDDEQTADGAIQRGRRILGGTGEFRGNGMAIRAGTLRAIGGWDPLALTEDLEATVRFASATGVGVRWRSDVEVWEQPVLDLAGLLRQRSRWAEGAVRRDLRVTWPMVLTGRVPARLGLDIAAFAAQTLMPWLALGLLSRSDRPTARRRLIALGGAYLVGATAVAAAGLGRLDRRVPGVIAISATWPVVLPIAWVRVALSRGGVRFSKTTHRTGFSRPPAVPDADAGARLPPQATDRPPATTRRDGAAAGRWRLPAAASDGPPRGSAAPTSHRTST